MKKRVTAFIINLLQDVSVVRPVALFASSQLRQHIVFLVSGSFKNLDSSSLWTSELELLALTCGARIICFSDPYDAVQSLTGMCGLLIAASESNLPAHRVAYDVFRAAPSAFIRITLQHGYECVGFLHNKSHDRAYGSAIRFASDLICGWGPISRMISVPPNERAKYIATGPASLLYPEIKKPNSSETNKVLVCENLHSVRLASTTNAQSNFLNSFSDFCLDTRVDDCSVTLRPHPGGQYTIKRNLCLPSGVTIETLPIYRSDLASFLMGISAPSSVVIDMVLAEIPVGVWRDDCSAVDITNYKGLAIVSDSRSWVDFLLRAKLERSSILLDQRRFLERSGLVFQRKVVRENYERLLAASIQFELISSCNLSSSRGAVSTKILVLSNSLLPTLQISFLWPLAEDINCGSVVFDILTESNLRDLCASFDSGSQCVEAIESKLLGCCPDLILLVRYSGLAYEEVVQAAKRLKIPTVYCIDDDLLNVPMEVGASKHKFHNAPHRLAAVRYLLSNSDLLYCSNSILAAQIKQARCGPPVWIAEIFSAGKVIKEAKSRNVTKIGYAASKSHVLDLEIVVPALVELLDENSSLTFEIFGDIPIPRDLQRFVGRVTTVEEVSDYEGYLRKLAELDWDIGIAPLIANSFNRVKNINKWIDYSSVGVAVIASSGGVYEKCCHDGCGLLVDDAGWKSAIQCLVDSPSYRFELVKAAQSKMSQLYSIEGLRLQIKRMFSYAIDPQGSGFGASQSPPNSFSWEVLHKRVWVRIIESSLENDIDWSQQLNHELNLCFSRDPVLEEFILLVNSSVKPTSSCLAFLEQAIRENPDADMIFGDEVVSDSGSWHKPGCSHALLLSQPYISSLLLLRRSLWLRVGGLREEFRDAAIYDLALRAIAASENIVHVPRILCEVESRWVVNELHRKASLDSCRQIGLNAKITSCDDVHVNRVSVSPKSTPRVSVIVPTRDSIDLLTVCIESVLDLSKNKELEVIIVDNGSKEPATLDRFELWRRERNVLILRSDCEFDYSALMNAAVSQSSAPLVTFLNNDTRIVSPHWVDEMCGWLELDEVGAVGAKLYYGDETIQHAGVVLGVGAVASHAFKREKRNASGYNSLLRCARDVSAVTAAFMMTKRSLFLDVRGFDSSLRVAYNDVDYCLKLRSLGFRVIWTPEVECFHFEGKTRGKDTRGNVRFEEEISIMRAKWGNEIASDPFYNPNLSKSHVDFRPRVV